ncbi:helix-turn-helix domain-containing protein [Belliella sp. R4-6]|uniref:Helix-turn-helix domain-containing protein n=1 Tax=Belliella alkalica TaxID=1730871 RepID=A0ABS9VCT8_9BACT|nr:helix-turn-helix transcriptional regulator [Belliella alkalica]MCH7414251.1 helix-turn-helix domain-containing protein [Belliella alkalica]
MKQPELGQKIQEWRKAKGLTQEELVEKCNINVRTIQRIEAGEVTPRPFTIKAILEVLEVNQNKDALEYLPKQEEISFSPSSKKFFLLAGISGIIYFLISILEFYWDGALLLGSSLSQPSYYATLKIFVFIFLFFFCFGFVRLGKELGSDLILIGSIFYISINFLIIGADIFYSSQFQTDYKLFGFIKLLSLGIGIIPLSIGFVRIQNKMGSIFMVAGIIGLLAGISLMTVIFSMIGLIFLTAFDILLIYLLLSIYAGGIFTSTKKDESGRAVLI